MNKYKVFIAGHIKVFADSEDLAVQTVEQHIEYIPTKFNVEVFGVGSAGEQE